MPIYNIKWTDWFLYLLLYSLHCSWFYPLLCSYRCCDTHRMSNIKVCVRGYLTSYMVICELTAVFFGVFHRRQVLIIPWTTHIVLSSFGSTRPTTCPGETCVWISECVQTVTVQLSCQTKQNGNETKQKLHRFPFAFNKDSGIKDGKRSEGTLTIPTLMLVWTLKVS